MRYNKSLLLLGVFSFGVYAQDWGEPFRVDSFGLGLGGSAATSEYKGYDSQYSVAPVIKLETPVFYIDGYRAGIHAFTTDDKAHDIQLGLTYNEQKFDPKDSDDYAMRVLDKRCSSLMAELSYRFYSDYGNFKTSYAHDIQGRSKGDKVTLAYGYDFTVTKGLNIEPSVGVDWTSKKFNEFYYGVSDSESAVSGLKAYKPKGGFSPFMSVDVTYEAFENFYLALDVGVKYLSSEIKDSPMVKHNNKAWSFLGFYYAFK